MTIQVIALLLLLLCLLSWGLIKWLIGFLINRKIVDSANERSLHQGVIPRGGGLVIVLVLIIGALFASVMSDRPVSFAVWSLLLIGWASLSWLDDRFDLSPHLRLFVQMVLAAFTLAAFGWITSITLSSNIDIPVGVVMGPLLLGLGIVWFTNLYNFMDGLDGLAAGQTIVAGITLGFWFYSVGDTWVAILCAALTAATYGFLLHNWHPAKIFMGDVGSITIGAFFATLIVYGRTQYQMPVLCFVVLFSVFVGDASITLIRRIINREKIWLPHRSHIYQRAAALGFDHDKIALTSIVLMCICAVLASICLSEHDRILPVIFATLILLALPLGWVTALESRHSTKNQR